MCLGSILYNITNLKNIIKNNNVVYFTLLFFFSFEFRRNRQNKMIDNIGILF